MELICYRYHDPRSFTIGRNDRESLTAFYCNHCDSCPAYKKKTCAMLNLTLFGYDRCPCGSSQKIEGKTKTARSCGQLINSYKTQYPGKDYALESLKHTSLVGDNYIFLNMPNWLELNHSGWEPGVAEEDRIPTILKRVIVDKHFIKLEDFNTKTIKALLEFRPSAIMGGEIKDYQKIHVPQLAYDIKKYLPDIYNKVIEEYPRLKELADTVTFVGKKAFVVTLLPGKVSDGTRNYFWDGEKLTIEGSGCLASIGSLTGFKAEMVVIYPDNVCKVTIVDDNTVCEDTEFC